MMLMGGFLTGAAAWVIIIEMRGRVRMVDTLARTGEREVLAVTPAAPELPVLDAPLDRLDGHVRWPTRRRRTRARVAPAATWEPGTGRRPPHRRPGSRQQQIAAAATLERVSRAAHLVQQRAAGRSANSRRRSPCSPLRWPCSSARRCSACTERQLKTCRHCTATAHLSTGSSRANALYWRVRAVTAAHRTHPGAR